jgi:RNA polymerase sigma-70 factor, ECF subfamily
VNINLKEASDEELARQSQAGSFPAFEELVFRYEHRIYSFLAQALRNATDARELTQDTFVKAHQAIGSFDPARNFATWLFTIARRKFVDHLRARPPRTDEPIPEMPDHNNPAELLARDEERDNLWKTAAGLLPPEQFQAVWLRYMEDLDVARIAHILRRTKTSVKVLLFRARLRLRSRLKSAVHRGGSRRAGSGESSPVSQTPLPVSAGAHLATSAASKSL